MSKSKTKQLNLPRHFLLTGSEISQAVSKYDIGSYDYHSAIINASQSKAIILAFEIAKKCIKKRADELNNTPYYLCAHAKDSAGYVEDTTEILDAILEELSDDGQDQRAD